MTLTEARCLVGLTMSALARALYVSRPVVSLWENGIRRPGPEYRRPLSALLGCEPQALDAMFAEYPPARQDGEPLPSLGLLRRRSGLSQRGLATMLGVAASTVAMWETAGIRVPADTASELGRILNVDLSGLTAQPSSSRTTDSRGGRPLRRFRIQAGMTQREAAAYLDVAIGTLARYEAGERPVPVLVARRMARSYGRPVAEVICVCGIELVPMPVGAIWRPCDVPQGIEAARVAAGMTRVGLGRAVGRSGQTVRFWETGQRRPNTVICRRLESVLGLPPGKLPY